MDGCIGATLTESGLLQRTPTEVELYTAISTPLEQQQPQNSNTDDESFKYTIELRANTSSSMTSMMVPLTMDGIVDTTKHASHYRDRTYFPFQMTITTHRIVFIRDRTISISTNNTTNNNTNSTTTTNNKTTREARYIHMSNVFSISTESFYFKSPKIICSTAMGEIVFAFLKGSPFTTTTASAIASPYHHHHRNPVQLRDDVYAALQHSYTQKQWDVDDAIERERLLQRKRIMSTKVGVDAIVSHTQQRHAHAKRMTDRAFDTSGGTPHNHHHHTTTTATTANGEMAIMKHSKNAATSSSSSSSSSDHLETFLMEATELVQVIQKYVATLDRSVSDHDRSSSGSTGGDDNDDTDQLVHMLQDMGMTSILNRNSNTKRNKNHSRNTDHTSSSDMYFYDTIARQVVDLIRPKLQRQTVPMITLTDVYCRYNRSRGTQLISPEDLLLAMERLDVLHLNLSLLTFPHSGLKVVQDPIRTNVTTLTETFLRLCQDNEDEYYHRSQPQKQPESTMSTTPKYYGYVTALSVSQRCHIPTILAYEQLQMVEQHVMDDSGSSDGDNRRRSKLVRDETLEVIRFYPNVFF